MTSLLLCIQAAKRAAKRKAAAQAAPADSRTSCGVQQPPERRSRASPPPPAPSTGLADVTAPAPVTAAALCAVPGEPRPTGTPQPEPPARGAQDVSGGHASPGPAAPEAEPSLPLPLPQPLPSRLPLAPESAPPASALPAFAARDFYGVPRLTAVELRVQRFLSHVRLRLNTAGHPYEVFPLQAQAFDFADGHELGDLLRCVPPDSTLNPNRIHRCLQSEALSSKRCALSHSDE